MNSRLPVILVGLLFAVPTLSFAGLNAYTWLTFLLLFYGLINPSILVKSNLFLQLPFLFILGHALIAGIYHSLHNSPEENRIVITKNLEIINQLLLAIYLGHGSSAMKVRKNIIVFIETYFYANIIYYIIKKFIPRIKYYFHPVDISNLLYSENGREELLGFEPSYTVPLLIIMFLLYRSINMNSWKNTVFGVFLAIIVVSGASKIGFAMILFFGISWITNKFRDRFGSFLVKSFSIFIVAMVAYIALINSTANFKDITSQSKEKQIGLISWITRVELSTISLNIAVQNPLGYGYGNGLVILSNYVEENIDSIISFEVKESYWTARSPKSQFLELYLGGGLIFVWIYVFNIQRLNKRVRLEGSFMLRMVLFLLVLVFIVIERIPYIVLISIFSSICDFRMRKMAVE